MRLLSSGGCDVKAQARAGAKTDRSGTAPKTAPDAHRAVQFRTLRRRPQLVVWAF